MKHIHEISSTRGTKKKKHRKEKTVKPNPASSSSSPSGQIGAGADALLVQLSPSLPEPTATFDNGNQLLGHLVRKASATTAFGPLFAGCIQNPHHRHPPPLPFVQRNGYL
jgi:hypothetical protein